MNNYYTTMEITSITIFLFLLSTTNPVFSESTAQVNEAGLTLIMEFEGFVASPKPDPIGLPTVGYGHVCKKKDCSEVPHKFPLTKEKAKLLLLSDLETFQSCVDSFLSKSVKLNSNQFSATVSLVFNIGCGNFRTSTLVKKLNKGDNPNTVAAEEFPKWNKAGGKVLPGLVRRRAAEVKLFQTPISS